MSDLSPQGLDPQIVPARSDPAPYLGTTPSDGDLELLTLGNSSFSQEVPGLQIAWDSTSLGTFKECPRKYYYTVVMGLAPMGESPHLWFGILLHGVRERYEHLRIAGMDHEEALRDVLHWLMCSTWDRDRNRAISTTHPSKNRLSLIRAAVWYLDSVAQSDSIPTMVLANGRPAVELSFSFQLEAQSSVTGHPLLLCGHLDRLGTLNDSPYVIDIKTTEHALGTGFFTRFSPDNQFSLYSLAGRVAFGIPVAGVVVDAVQVGANFARFSRGLVQRTEGQLEEWLDATTWWIGQAEDCATERRWPQNDKSCGLYGGCPFREICGKPPGARNLWLRSGFAPHRWDPLQRRGEP